MDMKELREKIQLVLDNFSIEDVNSCNAAIEAHFDSCLKDESVADAIRLDLGGFVKHKNSRMTCTAMLLMAKLIDKELNEGETITITTVGVIGFFMNLWIVAMEVLDGDIKSTIKKMSKRELAEIILEMRTKKEMTNG